MFLFYFSNAGSLNWSVLPFVLGLLEVGGEGAAFTSTHLCCRRKVRKNTYTGISTWQYIISLPCCIDISSPAITSGSQVAAAAAGPAARA